VLVGICQIVSNLDGKGEFTCSCHRKKIRPKFQKKHSNKPNDKIVAEIPQLFIKEKITYRDMLNKILGYPSDESFLERMEKSRDPKLRTACHRELRKIRNFEPYQEEKVLNNDASPQVQDESE